MRYIITSLGPIDRHSPGTDVTSLYSQEILDRLIREGYVEVEPSIEVSTLEPSRKKGESYGSKRD